MKWVVLLIIGVCCISTSAILVTLSQVEPTVSAFYRNLLAAPIWLFILRGRGLSPHSPLQVALPALRPSWLAGLIPQLGSAGLLTLLALFFAIDLWAWHRAIIFLGAGPATLIGNLQVVFVALLTLLVFQRHLPRFFWPGTILALLGIGLLTLSRGIGEEILWGLALGLFTALTYSFFLLTLKLLEHYAIAPPQLLFWVAGGTAFFLLPVLLWEGADFSLSGRALAILVVHSLISSVLGWWLIISAMARLPVTMTSTLLLLQPLLTHVWGDIFLGQELTGVQLLGIVVAVGGIRLANWQGGGNGGES
ncbi:MAG: DMT family transporter [Thermodesulfobacteriota bacterium]